MRKKERRSTAKIVGSRGRKHPVSRGGSGVVRDAATPASAFSANSPTTTVRVDSVEACLHFCTLALSEVQGILTTLAGVVSR